MPLEVLVVITVLVLLVTSLSLQLEKIALSLTCVPNTDTVEDPKTLFLAITTLLTNVPSFVNQVISLLDTLKLNLPSPSSEPMPSQVVPILMSVVCTDSMDSEMELILALIKLTLEPSSVNQVTTPLPQPLIASPSSQVPHSLDVPKSMNVPSMVTLEKMPTLEAVPMESTPEPFYVKMVMVLLELLPLLLLSLLDQHHSQDALKLICVPCMDSVVNLNLPLDVFLV